MDLLLSFSEGEYILGRFDGPTAFLEHSRLLRFCCGVWNILRIPSWGRARLLVTSEPGVLVGDTVIMQTEVTDGLVGVKARTSPPPHGIVHCGHGIVEGSGRGRIPVLYVLCD